MATAPLRRAVFFDRDGVLNEDDGGYTHRVEDLVWTPDAVEAVRAVNDAGWLAVVVTNQSGVGRGYYDEAAVHAFHDRMQADLGAAGARMDAFYACYHHPEAIEARYRHADHPDRKPNPGMLLKAAGDLGVDLSGSILIGDRQSDLEAARRAGASGVLYRGGSLRDLVVRSLAAASPAGGAAATAD